MTLGEIIAGKVAHHCRAEMNINCERDPHNQERILNPRFNLDSIIKLEEKNLNVLVLLPEEKKKIFGEYLLKMEKGQTWEDPALRRWKEHRDKCKRYLIKKSFKLNSDGDYHFKAEFKTNDPNKITHSVIQYVIKTIIYFDRIQKQN